MTGTNVANGQVAAMSKDDVDERPEVPVDEQPSTDEPTGAAEPAVDQGENSPMRGAGERRQLSFSVRSLVLTVIGVLLISAVATTTWLYVGARDQLAGQRRQVADERHAEQTALDYAVNAAVMDYKDLGPWKQKLVAGTSPELSDKLTKAAEAMEQIVLPMQWSSTAKPIAAKVRSHDNGVYVVDAFVSVMTKTVQAAESLQSTATYSVTVNPNDSWHITDVGGIGAVTADK